MGVINAKIFFIYNLLIVPLIYVNDIIDPATAPQFAALAAGLILPLASMTAGGRKLVTAPLHVLSGIYILLTILSLFYTLNFPDGLYEILKTALFLLLLLSFGYYLDVYPGAPAFIRKTAVTGSIILIFTAFVQLFRNGYELSHHIGATLGNKNLLAASLLMYLPFAALGAMREKGAWKFLSAGTLVLSVISILFLRSFAVLAGAVFGLAALMIVLARVSLKRAVRMNRFVSLAIPVLVAGAVLYFMAAHYNDIYSRAEKMLYPPALTAQSETMESNSLFERYIMIRNTWRMIKDNWILGTGAGSWKIVFPEYGISGREYLNAGTTLFQNPHNDFLWVWAETGIAAFTAYIAFFAYALWMSAVLIKKNPPSDGVLFFFTLAGFCVISAFDFPKDRIFILIQLSAILALMVHMTGHTRPVSGRITALTGIPVCLFCLYIGAVRIKGEYFLQKALLSQQKKEWDSMAHFAARTESPFFRIDPVGTPLAWYEGFASYYNGNTNRAKGLFERAYRIHPSHLHVINNLATLYAAAGDAKTAETLYQRALKITPQFYEGRINLSALYCSEGKYGKAREVLDSFPNKADSRYVDMMQKIENLEGIR